MINDKSLTAFTSCTSPGSLITEHGSSILSLKIENQPKSSARKMSYWLPNVVDKTNLYRYWLPNVVDKANLYRYSRIDSLFLLRFECLHIPAPRSKGKSTKPDEKQICLCILKTWIKPQVLISYKVKCYKFIGFSLSGIDLFHLLYLTNTNWSPFHHSSLGLPLAMPLGSQLRSSSFLLWGRFTADDSLSPERLFFWNFELTKYFHKNYSLGSQFPWSHQLAWWNVCTAMFRIKKRQFNHSNCFCLVLQFCLRNSTRAKRAFDHQYLWYQHQICALKKTNGFVTNISLAYFRVSFRCQPQKCAAQKVDWDIQSFVDQFRLSWRPGQY